MLKQMKKTLGILLAVCFLMSVTAAAVSAGPVVVKEKKTIIVAVKDVKTKIFKHPHQSQCQKHGINNITTTNNGLGEDANKIITMITMTVGRGALPKNNGYMFVNDNNDKN